MMSETKAGYSTFQVLLHWLVAVLVLFQLFVGESMTALVDAKAEGTSVSPTDQTLGSAHYWVGLVILALVAVRLVIRLVSKVPRPVSVGPRWMQYAASASHAVFYILLLATPIFGLLAFYAGDPWGDIHSLNKPVLILLISLHVLVAFYHHFWLRDGTLKRMLSPIR
jgi:cytochrome b561